MVNYLNNVKKKKKKKEKEKEKKKESIMNGYE